MNPSTGVGNGGIDRTSLNLGMDRVSPSLTLIRELDRIGVGSVELLCLCCHLGPILRQGDSNGIAIRITLNHDRSRNKLSARNTYIRHGFLPSYSATRSNGSTMNRWMDILLSFK
jgi:hypothetical protein